MTDSRKTIRIALLVAAGALAVCTGCRRDPGDAKTVTAFEVDQVHERGPVTVHVRLDRTKITIAETVLLQLEATVRPDYEIRMPKVDEALQDFGLVGWDHLGRRLDANNHVVTTYEYRLEPFLSGRYEIPAFTFTFHDVNEPDTKHELTSEPIAVEVTSLLGEQRAELVIEDIEDVVPMQRKATTWWAWLLVGAGLALASAGGLTWFSLRRSRATKTQPVRKAAHEIAYANLRALVARKLVEQGKIKEFYERISGILRYYIEHRFDLHAPERTTEEFLGELGWTDVLAGPDKAVLEEFLTHCDLVKFAKHDPTTEQIQRTFDLVKDFIERTKSDDATVCVAGCLGVPRTAQTGVA